MVWDIRKAAAAVRAAAPSIDEVAWSRFHHAYGPGADVPGLVRGLADPAVADRSRSELWTRLHHQGTTSDAGVIAVPYLVEAVLDPATPDRASVLRLVAEIGRRPGEDHRASWFQAAELDESIVYGVEDEPGVAAFSRVVRAGREAIAACADRIIPLLDDPDPRLRAAAAYTLAAVFTPPAAVPPASREEAGAGPAASREEAVPAVAVPAALHDRLEAETDPAVRISVILAIAQLAVDRRDRRAQSWAESLWSDPAARPEDRVGGALAWLCTTSAEAPSTLTDVLTTAGPDAGRWLREVPWAHHLDLSAGSLAEFMTAAPVASFGDRAAFAIEVGQFWALPHQRIVDLWIAGRLLTYDDNIAYLPSFVHLMRGTVDRVRRRDLPACPRPGAPPEEIFRSLIADDERRERYWLMQWGETLDGAGVFAYLDGDDLVLGATFRRSDHPDHGRVFTARLPLDEFEEAVALAVDALSGPGATRLSRLPWLPDG